MGKTLGSKAKSIPTKQCGKKHRLPVPPIDVTALTTLIIDYVKEVGIKVCFSFGIYMGVMLSQAVRGAGLAENFNLMVRLAKFSPTGLILHSHLKTAITDAAMRFEGLCPSSKPLERWPSK